MKLLKGNRLRPVKLFFVWLQEISCTVRAVRCTSLGPWSTSVPRAGKRVFLPGKVGFVGTCPRLAVIDQAPDHRPGLDWGKELDPFLGPPAPGLGPFWTYMPATLGCLTNSRGVLAIGVGVLHTWGGPRCWRNGLNRPVLKHGPRSLTCMRVLRVDKTR